MRWLLCATLMIGLASCRDPFISPILTRVDTSQEYTMPGEVLISMVQIPDLSTLRGLCNDTDAFGCTQYGKVTIIYIYSGSSDGFTKNVAEHEMQHVVYGPLHWED